MSSDQEKPPISEDLVKELEDKDAMIEVLKDHIDQLKVELKLEKERKIPFPRGKNRRIDLMNMWFPSWQLTHLRQPEALIIVGKHGFFRKLPRKSEYFVDKDFGLFEMKPGAEIMCGKVPLFIYDNRNQNPLHPGILQDLWKWANLQGLYKIRRVDVEHAKALRTKDLETLKKEQKAKKLTYRSFTNKVLEGIKERNTEIEKLKRDEAAIRDSEEYQLISDEKSRYLIVQNMFEKGYIDVKQADILNHRLKTKEITSVDDLLVVIDSFTDILVTKPITFEMERVLDDYHTYKPRDFIILLKVFSNLHKGFKNLRTKALINWFPSTYLLFGALGVGIVIMIWLTYGDQFSIPGFTP